MEANINGMPSSMRPFGPFYMEDVPVFEYDPENPFMVNLKKEEILRLRLSWGIRSRYPDSWVDDLKSQGMKEKWLNEAKERLAALPEVIDPYADPEPGPISTFSAETWDQMIDELGQYAGKVDGRMQPGPLDGVTWIADGLVGQGLRDRLLAGSEALEKVARKEGNWHPGTEGRVLNLIDPSMHALIPEHTLVLDEPFVPANSGLVGDMVHFPSSASTSARVHAHGSGFQWLPAEVDVGLDGSCHFRSYVNNLNPSEDGEMYGVLKEIFSTTFVPLWEKLLTHMRREQSSDESEDEILDQCKCYEVDAGKNGNEIDAVDLKGRRIQVIVRMATTHLSPGDDSTSKHPGGRWHTEGVPAEKIVAVGLHYYSNQNITTAKLGLGEKFKSTPREPGWIEGTPRRHVISDSRELVTIETKEGRSVVFSNQLNHRVLPFELENPALPGHRKILAFFLVDPGTPIISTARVPCQQRSWFVPELRRVFSPILPLEMVDIVASFLDTPMDLNKAKEFRDALRDHRTYIILRVVSQDSNEIHFRVKLSIKLERLKLAYSQRLGVPVQSNRFLYDGHRVDDIATPGQLEMVTGDVIEVYGERTD